MTSSIVWAFFCAAVVDRLFRRAGARWASVTYKLCAAAFLALAVASIRDVIVHSPPPASEQPAAIGAP
jgi:chemosensory pili system protein ChpE/L-lysine exporter family protein LysE/ArgO